MALSQAPELKFNGEDRDESGRGKAIRTHDLEDAIMNGLDGRDMVALKIMFFLTGQAEGFRIAEKTILTRCHIDQKSYINARKKLVEKGWLVHSPGGFIAVNITKIFKDYKTGSNAMSEDKKNKETGRNAENTGNNTMSETGNNTMHNNLIENTNYNNLNIQSLEKVEEKEEKKMKQVWNPNYCRIEWVEC